MCVVGLAILIAASAALLNAQTPQKADFRNIFSVDKARLSSTGGGTYWILEPGSKLHLQAGKDTLVVTVLEETKVVDGVTTRIVEERETEGGQLVEISRNYFAIDNATGDVYYFGEDVDMYKNGKVTGHEGAWLSGMSGARFGLMVPGAPKVGDRYYQEWAPKVAMDRAQVVAVTEEVKVPAARSRTACTRRSRALSRVVRRTSTTRRASASSRTPSSCWSGSRRGSSPSRTAPPPVCGMLSLVRARGVPTIEGRPCIRLLDDDSSRARRRRPPAS